MNEILVSVIVPVLNGEKYIVEMLKSLVNQTLIKAEFIIVDGGSTDKTLEIIDCYSKQDPRIVLIHSDVRSSGAQYNKGIYSAKGEYIGFCEADDYLDTNMLKKLYDLAKENDLDFIKSTFEHFFSVDGSNINIMENILGADNKELYNTVIDPSRYARLISIDIRMWNGLFKRDFLFRNSIKLNETSGASFQDIGFNIQTFALAKRIMYVSGPSYHYRRDNDNSSVYSEKRCYFHIQEFMYYREFYCKNKDRICGELNARVLARFYRDVGANCDKVNDAVRTSQGFIDRILLFSIELKKALSELSMAERLLINCDTRVDLSYLFEDVVKYIDFRKISNGLAKRRRSLWFDIVNQYNNLVIFGAGDVGRYTVGLLLKLGYNNIRAVYDNDTTLTGKNLLGINISIPKACSDNNDTLYIIAMSSHKNEVIDQLLSFGVNRNNIISTLTTSCYVALAMEN